MALETVLNFIKISTSLKMQVRLTAIFLNKIASLLIKTCTAQFADFTVLQKPNFSATNFAFSGASFVYTDVNH